MFAADAAASQVPDRASPATTSSPTPSSAPVGNRNIPQSSSSNSLLAALLPGASTSPAPQTARTTSSPVPPPTQTDNQSMARLMEMLHMSSAPAHVQSPAIKIASRPPGGIAIEGAATTQVKTTSSPQAAAHQAANPAYKEVRVPRNGQEQSLQAPNNLLDSAAAQQYPTAQRKEAIASPQQVPHSRLANRTSGHLASTANGESNLNQGAQRQGQVHSPVPPPQPSVNLLDLLAGHATSSPAASLPPNARDIPRPQQPTYQTHQYQPQQVRGQPMHSPPALGHFSPPASNIPVPMPFGNAGRPSGPPGVPSPANMPYGRPPPGGYMPTPGPHPPQHGPPPTQQHPHPSHMRSPSGHILSQVPQQRALQNGQHQQQYMQSGPANQPLPPPQAFAQQNALAQLLAQGGHPGQQFGGMRSPPNVPPGFQQHQTLPPPQIHMQQNTSPMHGHQNPPPVQQNQIDLMALLTGGGHGSNFASR